MAADFGRLTILILLHLTAAFSTISHSNLLNQLISVKPHTDGTSEELPIPIFSICVWRATGLCPWLPPFHYLLPLGNIFSDHCSRENPALSLLQTWFHISPPPAHPCPFECQISKPWFLTTFSNAVEMRQNWSPHRCPALSAQ